jgi:hypothetical protein
MATARILVESERARIYAPYELREVIKSLPGRSWDRDRKCWWISTALVDEAANVLRVSGCEVFVTRPDGSAWSSGRPGAGIRGEPGSGWADLLLEAVGPSRRDQVFRALAKVLHPDVGGDAVLMRDLIAAREQACAAGRSW